MPKHSVVTDNKLAEVPNPRSTTEDTRYHPDASKLIGTPPVNGTGGERGSSAFTGDAEFNADGSLKDVRPSSHYPLKGTDNWENTQYTGNHS